MPKRSSKKSTNEDEAQAAVRIVAAIAERSEKSQPTAAKNPAAVALGRLGGLKGGNARAAKLSPKTRSEIAKKAAAARWKRTGEA